MNMNNLYPLAAIAITALVTWALRALPFILFRNRPLPKSIHYLGTVLPFSIMTILVIYCLRNIDFHSAPFGMIEIVSSLLVILLQCIKKNMYLSIIAGTVCYMVLLRI